MNNKIKILAVAAAVAVLALLGVSCLGSRDEELLIASSDYDTGMSVASEHMDEEAEEPSSDLPTSNENKIMTSVIDMGTSPQNEMVEDKVVVHICGQVVKPGVYTLSVGSRVYQIIEMAGGFTDAACQDFINQADVLYDGMKVYVPSKDEISEEALRQAIERQTGNSTEARETGTGSSGTASDYEGALATTVSSASTVSSVSSASSGVTAKVNINTATKEELMTLRGIGEAKAEKIIAYRESQGGFASIEEIMNIAGIKEGMFDKIKDYISVN